MKFLPPEDEIRAQLRELTTKTRRLRADLQGLINDRGQSGSALMRDLDHALRLIEATISAVKVPVTLKMRLGWDDRSLNAPDLARRAEGAGR